MYCSILAQVLFPSPAVMVAVVGNTILSLPSNTQSLYRPAVSLRKPLCSPSPNASTQIPYATQCTERQLSRRSSPSNNPGCPTSNRQLSYDNTVPLLPKNLLTVIVALNTIAANPPPTTVARNSTLSICMRFLRRQRSTKPSVSFVRGNFFPSGTGHSRNSHRGFQPSPILYSRRFSAGTRARISS